MGALLNLWNSEKGLVGLLLLIAATVLTAIGRMPLDEWTEYTMVIFGTYVVGKTVQGVATTVVESRERREENAFAMGQPLPPPPPDVLVQIGSDPKTGDTGSSSGGGLQ